MGWERSWDLEPETQPGFANDWLCDFGPIKGSKTPLYMGIFVGMVQGDPVLDGAQSQSPPQPAWALA